MTRKVDEIQNDYNRVCAQLGQYVFTLHKLPSVIEELKKQAHHLEIEFEESKKEASLNSEPQKSPNQEA